MKFVSLFITIPKIRQCFSNVFFDFILKTMYGNIGGYVFLNTQIFIDTAYIFIDLFDRLLLDSKLSFGAHPIFQSVTEHPLYCPVRSKFQSHILFPTHAFAHRF